MNYESVVLTFDIDSCSAIWYSLTFDTVSSPIVSFLKYDKISLWALTMGNLQLPITNAYTDLSLIFYILLTRLF